MTTPDEPSGRSGMPEPAASLLDRAIEATGISVIITDRGQPDDPLIWVNAAFTATTGYGFDEAIGRNCRFLQGQDTDRTVVAAIRHSLQAGQPFTRTLLNYRKDGTPFWNEVAISPVHDNSGAVTHFVGVQSDVTARVDAQQARDEAMARAAVAVDRLGLLADFTSRMSMCQHPQEIVELLGEVLVPGIGAWCVVLTVDEVGRLAPPYVRHERGATDVSIADSLTAFRAVVPDQLQAASPVWRVLRGEQPFVLIDDFDAAPPEITGAAGDDRTSLIHKLGARSIVAVPLLARGGILGCVAVIADHARPVLGEAELALVRDLSVRAALMLENTQLLARESAAASTLQRSLLPQLPELSGIDVAASYIPAADEVAVGGDWYDVFELRAEPPGKRGGGVGVVVGDVMGHNIHSAARMGKLSTLVHAYGWPGTAPREVLTAVDDILGGSGLSFLATCLYAQLAPHSGGATLRYSSAGHPPAILRDPDGRAQLLDGGRGPMIGVSQLMRPGSARPADAMIDMAAGSTLICFTDGLVDAFADEPDLDVGLAQLRRQTSRLARDATPQQIIDELTGSGRRRHKDDVAVVAIRIA